MVIKKCKGCGAILQSNFEDKPGFIPSLDGDAKYCKRCFRIKNYNELPKIVASSKDYENVIDSVLEKNGLMILIVDIFAFKATFNRKMIEKLRGHDVILVANKYDLFPKSTNPETIVSWLSHQCEAFSFKVLGIFIVSSKQGYFIDDLMNFIDFTRKGRNVYFVGCANVGKSSLINALLKRNTSLKEDVISTSIIPGTTLDEITIPFFEDNKAFVDTPGLINESDILNNLMPKSYRTIIPNSELKPKTFQLYTPNVIFLAGLASLDFTMDSPISVLVYTSNSLYIHRAKSENIDKMYETQLGKLLTPPTADELNNIEYVSKEFVLDGKKKKDIWFSGFGFVSVIGACKVKVKYIKNTEVFITNGIIGKN